MSSHSRMLFVLLLVIAATLGCGHTAPPPAQLPGWALATGPDQHPRPREGIRGRSESSDFVVAALQSAGLRFGTDGTVRALWKYLRDAHPAVPPTAARPGDVLLFRVAPVAGGEENGCDTPDDAAIVSEVDGTGRIGFIQARHGRAVLSFVDPMHPRMRRDQEGQVRNSFLRVAHPGEPAWTPLLAGEMLCAVSRPLG